MTNPPHGIRNKLHALIGVELPYCLEQAFIAYRDELAKVETVALILFDVRNHESEIRGDQPLCCLFVTSLRTTRQTPLFFGVGDQWKLLYVLEVLVERGGGG